MSAASLVFVRLRPDESRIIIAIFPEHVDDSCQGETKILAGPPRSSETLSRRCP